MSKNLRRSIILLLVAVWTTPVSHAARPVIDSALAASREATIDLEAGWQNPPPRSRVYCWWWWLNGNVTKEAITRDLEAMHAKGYGGANIIDAGHGGNGHDKPPHGPDFASPEWCELFVHALAEAERLDLELGLNIQSGWNLGGPTVTPDQASKKLAWNEQTIVGGKSIKLELAEPRQRQRYYHDVAIFAIPLPADDRPVARIDAFRQKAYHEYPGGFAAINADFLLDAGEPHDGEYVVQADDVIDLSSHVDEQGQLAWDAPQGMWRIVRLGYTLSSSAVSTSSDNWNGLVIDYLDSQAFDKYCDDVLSPILATAGSHVGKSLKFLHTDSWELGPVNWTPALPQHFAERRGYQMQRYWPALVGYVVDDRESSNRFLNDFRRTLADLIADGKYRRFSDYAHERGLGIHPESGGPHCAPVDALLCLGRSDIPMGEYWARSRTHRVEDTARLFVKQPASAAHTYGRRYVMAEAFTTIGPQWEKDPRMLKPDFDRVACEGLNRVMWHTFDCSPTSQGKPGQAYFAGTHLNPQVTWWEQADGFLGYLNRCQFLLQQGLPVADVLYFYGENVPSFVRLQRDDPADVTPDYDYDVINAEALIARTSVVNGRITLPEGTNCAVLALPASGHYSLASLRHIARLVDEGAVVVGPQPAHAIGLDPSPEAADEFHSLAQRLWSSGDIVAAPAGQVLQQRKLVPDFAYKASGEAELNYIHRQTDDADIYFVCNRRDEAVTAECLFRVEGRQPELWNPVTRDITPVASSTDQGQTRVQLSLEAYGSIFVVFRDAADAVTTPSPRPHTVTLRPVAEVKAPWQVTFDPTWGGPGQVTFDDLVDWTEQQDDGIRYYSGTAVYTATLNVPGQLTSEGRYWLDLGDVHNSARVFLNGKDLGVTWTAPFRVDVTSGLRAGKNDLRIEVINLWPNRLIGDSSLPAAERYTKTNINKFLPDSPLLPSGLLGPVQLLSESNEPVAARAAAPSR